MAESPIRRNTLTNASYTPSERSRNERLLRLSQGRSQNPEWGGNPYEQRARSDMALARLSNDEAFSEVINRLSNGQRITFTPNNVYMMDDFLRFRRSAPRQTLTFERGSSGVWRVRFDDEESILLENTPSTFWRSILKNI